MKKYYQKLLVLLALTVSVGTVFAAHAQTGLATLSTDAKLLVLAPGATAYLEIRNVSTSTATNVTFVMPSELEPYVVATYPCTSIAPGGTCDLGIQMSSKLSTSIKVSDPAEIFSTDTFPLYLPISIT